MAKELEQAGAHVLGLKDMAGLLRPAAARVLIKALKEEVGLFSASILMILQVLPAQRCLRRLRWVSMPSMPPWMPSLVAHRSRVSVQLSKPFAIPNAIPNWTRRACEPSLVTGSKSGRNMPRLKAVSPRLRPKSICMRCLAASSPRI